MNSSLKKGAVTLLLVVLFSEVSLITVLGGLGSTTALSARSQDLVDSKKTVLFADGLVDDVVYRVKSGKQVQDGETISLGDVAAGVRVDETGSTKTVTIFGTSTDIARNVRVVIDEGAVPTFARAVSIDIGGITMNSNARIVGDVHTNGSITGHSNSRITGNATAAGNITSPSPKVTGTKESGVSEQALPAVDIEYWKAQANINNDPISGFTLNSNQQATYGPKKIQGTVNLNSNTKLYVTGPLHITGNLNINSNADIILQDSLGSEGTVIVVDGSISINSNGSVQANNANPPGHPVLATETSGSGAVGLNSNGAMEGLIYAPNANMQMSSNSEAIAVIAKSLSLSSNARINYDDYLTEQSYGGGEGSVELSGWQEVE